MRAVNRQPWIPREGLVETADHCTTFNKHIEIQIMHETYAPRTPTRMKLDFHECYAICSQLCDTNNMRKRSADNVTHRTRIQTSARHASIHRTIHLARVYKHESNFLEKFDHVTKPFGEHSSLHRIFLDMVGISFESYMLQLCFGQFSSKSVGWIKSYDQFCEIFQ